MAEMSGRQTLDIFNFAQHGVNNSLMPIKRRPGEWTEVQNGQPSYVFGLGAIEKRGGMVPHNAVALAGPVVSFANVPLASLFDGGSVAGIFAMQNTDGAAPFWTRSEDAADWSTPTGIQAVAGRHLTATQSIGMGTGVLYFFGAGSNDLLQYNGGVSSFVAAGDWPAGELGASFQTPGCILVVGETVYVGALYDDLQSYVIVIEAGVPSILGGVDIGVAAGLGPAPLCLYVRDSTLFIGIQHNNFPGRIYTFDLTSPGDGYTLEATLPQVNLGADQLNAPTSIVEFDGELYVSTVFAAGEGANGNANVYARGVGSWSTSITGASWAESLGEQRADGLRVFDSRMFVVYASGTEAEVWTWDGGTFSLDVDLIDEFGVDPSNVQQGASLASVSADRFLVSVRGTAIYARTPTIANWAQAYALPGGSDRGAMGEPL